jgi:hypothetical protein
MKIQLIFVAFFVIFLELNCSIDGLDLPDDFCAGIDFGVFPYPDDCTKYVVCITEIGNVGTCSYPNLVFYNGTCVEGDPTSCEVVTDIPPTTVTEDQTTEMTTTANDGLPSDFCIGIDFALLPYPGNCTLYVVCMNSNTIINTCPNPNVIFYNNSCVEGK